MVCRDLAVKKYGLALDEHSTMYFMLRRLFNLRNFIWPNLCNPRTEEKMYCDLEERSGLKRTNIHVPNYICTIAVDSY